MWASGKCPVFLTMVYPETDMTAVESSSKNSQCAPGQVMGDWGAPSKVTAKEAFPIGPAAAYGEDPQLVSRDGADVHPTVRITARIWRRSDVIT